MVDQETLNTFDKLYYDTYQDVLKYIVINCSNISMLDHNVECYANTP